MPTKNRLAILTAILAAPLLAMAAPSDSSKGDGPHGPCQCSCQAKTHVKTDNGGRIDFFQATANNPVP